MSFFSAIIPRRSPTVRPRAGFYHLVAGLVKPTALLIKARFSNLLVFIGQDFLILLPYMTDRSIITNCERELNSWAPANPGLVGIYLTYPNGLSPEFQWINLL